MLRELFFNQQQKAVDYSEEDINILRLIRSENVGPKTFFALVKLFGSVGKALDNAADFSLRGGRSKPIKVSSEAEALKELRALDKVGARFITFKSPDYSEILFNIPDFPPLLTYCGNLSILKKKCFAIVGSRNASINGKSFAAKIATELAEQGYTIVSGLARGVDTAAHEAATPATIAVIAGGIDYIYPPENARLYEKMAGGEGLILAEGQVGSKPIAQHFPQRNRLISGLSLGVLVVEASLKSGSLITARFALEQGREVFAVPGFPLDPRCQGTNKLLKDGAILVESTADIISNLANYEIEKKVFEERINNDNSYKHLNVSYLGTVNDQMRKKIVGLLSSAPTGFEMLVEASGLPLQIVHLIILELELAGRITKIPGNRISLVY